MMFLLPTLLILVSLFFTELLYFKIANHFNIIDKPNERSSHTAITLRGGGIIFCLAGLLFFVSAGYQYPYFVLGLLAIATVSFLDDVLTLNNKVRLLVHLLSVMLLFYQWNLFELPWYVLLIAVVFVIGTINAYNFMDGINGLTGAYSLLAICTLYYLNEKVVNFTSSGLIIIVGLSLLVFNFFNFRKKAKCFAGDVGSVAIAFIIIFLLGQLLLKTANFSYILLLLFYGLDTVTTIVFRKIRKENIFEAHRSHFYQYLANQLQWNHLLVAAFYCTLQLLINLLVVFLFKTNIPLALLFTALITVGFVILRFRVEGKHHLLKPQH